MKTSNNNSEKGKNKFDSKSLIILSIASLFIILLVYLYLNNADKDNSWSEEEKIALANYIDSLYPTNDVSDLPLEKENFLSENPFTKFSLLAEGGRTIHASVFKTHKYGSGRLLIIFAPFLSYSDGNFYIASLSALHNIYGKQRGLFLLEEARKKYDETIQSKVIYWSISNPNQSFYSFPIVDTDTETISSIVVWTE
ncbi:MAG: hypothetical protein HY960_11130 [Ignavibacteriae bacterium]|nr:hypothetical protein [Ignavibacteriota bacterium]